MHLRDQLFPNHMEARQYIHDLAYALKAQSLKSDELMQFAVTLDAKFFQRWRFAHKRDLERCSEIRFQGGDTRVKHWQAIQIVDQVIKDLQTGRSIEFHRVELLYDVVKELDVCQSELKVWY